MAQNKENKATGEAQESLKNEKTYKVTCGTYKAQNEALRKAAEAKKKGINVALTISAEGYSLFYAEGMTKAAADAAKKEIEAAGLKAEISEQ